MWEVTQIVEHQFLLIPGDLQSLLLPLPLPRPDLHCSVALCPQRIPVCLSNTLHPLPPSTIHVYFHLHIHVLRNPKRIVDWGMGIAECANCVSLMDLSLSLLKRKQCVSVLMITGYLFIFFLAPPSTYLLYPISHSLSTWIVSDIFFLLLLFIFYERHLSLFRFCSRCSSLFHFRFCLSLVLASFSLCCAIFLLVPPSLFFLLRLLLFLFLLLFVLSSFPLLLLFSFLLLLLLLLCLTCLILSFLSGISFDLIIILSRHDRKPPTRHSCPPSKAIASPFHFYPHSPSPSLLRHNNRNRVNIEQVFSGAICIPLPRQPPLRVRAR